MGWISYAPHGAVAAMQMGNNLWQVYSYNSRLQVQRIEDAVNNDPSQVLLDQHFEWGTTKTTTAICSRLLPITAAQAIRSLF